MAAHAVLDGAVLGLVPCLAPIPARSLTGWANEASRGEMARRIQDGDCAQAVYVVGIVLGFGAGRPMTAWKRLSGEVISFFMFLACRRRWP